MRDSASDVESVPDPVCTGSDGGAPAAAARAGAVPAAAPAPAPAAKPRTSSAGASPPGGDAVKRKKKQTRADGGGAAPGVAGWHVHAPRRMHAACRVLRGALPTAAGTSGARQGHFLKEH